MSSPLPVNAKNYRSSNTDDQGLPVANEDLLSTSFDRASSTARLSSSPIPPHIYGTSPARSIGGMSSRTYGSTNNHYTPAAAATLDLDRVPTNSSASLFRTASNHQYGDNLDLPEDQVARAVKRHLVDTSPAGSLRSSSSARPIEDEDETAEDGYSTTEEGTAGGRSTSGVTSVHQLPGGSITHEIYKWTEAVENEQAARRQRSRSVVFTRNTPEDPALARLKDPGGFRRHFVVKRAVQRGKAPPNWMTRTFVDFLALYGHFGGEDLSDDEEEEEDDDERERRRRRRHRRESLLSQEREDEEAPLIPPPEDAVQGTATPSKAVFLLLKSFIGTGVMFLPKAFYNGGLIFSSALLTFIAVVSLYSFLLLVETRNKVPVSFGDIGGVLFGPTMRIMVLIGITTSQIGFVCAYMVFVAQNLQALVEAISNCQAHVPLAYLILVQIIVFVPLAMIRKIQKLSVFALIADVFILVGLVYLYYFDFKTLAVHGIGNIQWVINPTSFPMFIGTAVFTFEGVGLVIPITESMKEPKKFPKVLSGTMIFITILFLSVGAISYLAFGSEVQTVILLNLPPSPIVNSVQGLYALAICLSIPLQLFPAIRIVETGLFTRSGKHNPVVKWQKNAFRFLTVLACAAIAIAGSGDLDKFVSLIGSLCCVPLCFLFPPLFHLKAIARTWQQKALDIAIIVFGVVSMTYTTFITVSLWTASGEPAPPISRCIPDGY
ncbi:neutral amino acid transporter [Apophysomyces sp. BC1034]|nr:neutral amino acid transporter [Apophysomyces sp. BC1015]KAG0181241.1 neutral amino acid transporter [Apophysomyces sp. BC1021]KAG0191677.1 neutral amino acid transporter [Apophysomyces sp. BC1034]